MIDDSKRRGILALLALLAGALLLAIAPMHLAEVRMGGVSVLWWYVALVAPITAAAIAVISLVRRTS